MYNKENQLYILRFDSSINILLNKRRYHWNWSRETWLKEIHLTYQGVLTKILRCFKGKNGLPFNIAFNPFYPAFFTSARSYWQWFKYQRLMTSGCKDI